MFVGPQARMPIPPLGGLRGRVMRRSGSWVGVDLFRNFCNRTPGGRWRTVAGCPRQSIVYLKKRKKKRKKNRELGKKGEQVHRLKLHLSTFQTPPFFFFFFASYPILPYQPPHPTKHPPFPPAVSASNSTTEATAQHSTARPAAHLITPNQNPTKTPRQE